jgi:beta-glucuronidase
MKELGFNALRSAHYSHDEILATLADEVGLLLLEEIPLYWDCDFANPRVQRLAARMLRDLVSRDYNHPSVVIWSVANEIPVEDLACSRLMVTLMTLVKKWDPTRLVTYAGNRDVGDTTRRACDVNMVNCYYGWYYLTVYNASFFLDAMYSVHQNSPWIISEFGAGAKRGLRDPGNQFSEDHQARTLSYQIQLFNSKPYLAGWFIWIYRDFRSHLRTNQYQQGFNRKGLVDELNRPKLMARVMPRYVKRTLPGHRMHRFLPHLYALVTRYLSRFAMVVSGVANGALRHKVRKGYKKHAF